MLRITAAGRYRKFVVAGPSRPLQAVFWNANNSGALYLAVQPRSPDERASTEAVYDRRSGEPDDQCFAGGETIYAFRDRLAVAAG